MVKAHFNPDRFQKPVRIKRQSRLPPTITFPKILNFGKVEHRKALADNESSVASFGAKNMLAFVDNQLLELHDYFEPVRVLEVDYFPQDGVSAKKDESETTFEKSIDQIAFSAYPNPTTGVINFDTKGVSGQIFIYDLRGQLISTLLIEKDEALVSFNANSLSSGIYLASFKSHGVNIQTLRIVKQ